MVSSGGTALITSADDCNAASVGTLTEGTAVSGVTQDVTFTVATAGEYNISAMANGVTFSGSGTFAGTGSQTITLTASGTPTAAGTHTYTLSTSPNCSFDRVTETATSLPANITLTAGQKAYIPSTEDSDYLPYTPATTVATTATQAADGTPDTTVSIQGTLDATGITVSIPYTVTGGGSVDLPAFSTTETIPAF